MQESTLIPMTDIPYIAPSVLPAPKQDIRDSTRTDASNIHMTPFMGLSSLNVQVGNSGSVDRQCSAPKDARTTVFLSSYHEHKRSSYSFVGVHPLHEVIR